MTLRARLKRLEKVAPAASVHWANLYATRPQDIVPDKSGIDWHVMYDRCEVTDPVGERVNALLALVPQPVVTDDEHEDEAGTYPPGFERYEPAFPQEGDDDGTPDRDGDAEG